MKSQKQLFILLIVLFFTLGCEKAQQLHSFSPEEPNPPVNDLPDPGDKLPAKTQTLITNLILEKYDFTPGEIIKLTVTLTNPNKYPVRLSFGSGSWIPYFTLIDKNNAEIWSSLHGKCFICLYAEEDIAAGETWIHTETWNTRDNNGDLVAPGNYELTAVGYEDLSTHSIIKSSKQITLSLPR